MFIVKQRRGTKFCAPTINYDNVIGKACLNLINYILNQGIMDIGRSFPEPPFLILP